MADNSSVPVASGNETFANKDISGVKFPKGIQYDSAGAEVIPPTATQVGTLTETAPASDTASSGLNGRLQRVAQRITSMIAAFPTLKAASTGAAAASDSAWVVTLRDGNANGGATAANSAPVVPADQYAQYETVAASATAQALGATGATGDYLAGVLVFPGTAGCGVVTILDNAVTIGTFAGGGTTALADLKPFLIPVGLFSVSGAWKITTGANVTAVGIGKFT